MDYDNIRFYIQDPSTPVVSTSVKEAVVSTSVQEAVEAKTSYERFLVKTKWQDTCTIMNGGKFPTYSYTFLMDFTSRKDSKNNYRLAAKNTELFAGLT